MGGCRAWWEPGKSLLNDSTAQWASVWRSPATAAAITPLGTVQFRAVRRWGVGCGGASGSKRSGPAGLPRIPWWRITFTHHCGEAPFAGGIPDVPVWPPSTAGNHDEATSAIGRHLAEGREPWCRSGTTAAFVVNSLIFLLNGDCWRRTRNSTEVLLDPNFGIGHCFLVTAAGPVHYLCCKPVPGFSALKVEKTSTSTLLFWAALLGVPGPGLSWACPPHSPLTATLVVNRGLPP